MTNNHNCLISREDERDFIKGVNSPLRGQVNLQDGDWTPYFMFDELQKVNGFETDGCVIFAAQEIFDAQIEFLIRNNKIPAAIIQFFTEQGYMDADNSTDKKPHFHTSARYIQVLTGNGFNGNALQDPWNAMRKYGCIPYKDLPFDATISEQEYLSPLPQTLLDKGQLFLAQIGGKNAIQYHWINKAGAYSFSSMDAERQQTPLHIGVNVGDNWNSSEPPPPPVGSPPGHSVANYTRVPDGEMVEDHYIPYEKLLVNGYPIPQVMQAVITIIPPPPPPTIPPAPTIPQTISWLTQLSAWLRNILESITPTGRAKLGGAARSVHWEAFKKEYAKTHLPVCSVCGGTKALNLHHLKPFHVYPQLELDSTNVLWLCNEKECHIRVGHLGDFKSINPNGKEDIALWRDKIRKRPMTSDDIKRSFNP